MFGVIGRAAQVLDTYLIAPMTGKISTASFWYIPEPPAFVDADGFRRYVEPTGRSPIYPIDHRAKTNYTLVDPDGVIVLRYAAPTGDQINPEACFQFALGLHDRWLSEGDESLREHFLFYARYFRDRQTDAGDFAYLFDYGGQLRAPWFSPLAQSRGASVMLRAFLITEDMSFREAALKALRKFTVPISEGGCLGYTARTGSPYFEEYPPDPTEVINGFMAAAIGPWELARFLNAADGVSLAALAKTSLEKMLPEFTLSWWSIYDQNRRDVFPNYHSPRYHRMCIGYLQVLALMFESETIADHARIWNSQFTVASRARATALKFARKSLYPI
jgi:D-glucuronyl C5-epimerase C-terminus